MEAAYFSVLNFLLSFLATIVEAWSM
jgi:hypothetical protein